MRRLVLMAPFVMSNFAAAAPAQKTFAPKNTLHLQDHLFMGTSEIDKEKFNATIKNIEELYKPIVAAHNATLKIEGDWDDETVNAYAMQEGSTWNVKMFGGLARRPETTSDGFALVVCHELGHHLAGFSFYSNDPWAANEGQSDYFSTQACARKIWRNETDENAKWRNKTHATVMRKCNAVWSSETDQNLCYRSGMAGKSLAELLGAISGNVAVDFDKPDAREVSQTNSNHPEAQCRMDTYLAGALCKADFDESIIPGKDQNDGNNSAAAEAEAAKYSCMTTSGYKVGLRPRCWFAPRLPAALDKTEVKLEEVAGNSNDAWEPGETFAINVPLYNKLLTSLDDATLTLSSKSDKVQVADTIAHYPQIQAGKQELAETGINVTVNSAFTCGTNFSLEAHADVGPTRISETFNFLVGKLTEEASHQETTDIKIPDNDRKGVSVSHNFTKEGTVNQGKISVDIEHSYSRDLVIKLQTPSGKEFILFKNEYSRGGIKRDFSVKLDHEAINGEWKIVVIDSASLDKGKIKSFGISLESITCENGHYSIEG